MIAYAGIGSRKITEIETNLIIKIAGKLSDAGIVLYSGNADGSDIAFQNGSKRNCVLMLPWAKFNYEKFNKYASLDRYIVGQYKDGIDSIEKYHPNPTSLTYGGKCLMARNWYQIMGVGKYPMVSFVVCCADRDKNKNIVGGTGQAVRIAIDKNIPVFNIRDVNWNVEFVKVLNKLKRKL